MKNKFAIIGLVSATLLLISCSPDDFQEENQELKQTEVEFNAENVYREGNENIQYDKDGNPLNPKDKG